MYHIAVLTKSETQETFYREQLSRFCAERGLFPRVDCYRGQEVFFEVAHKNAPTNAVISLPGVDGLNAVEHLRALFPETRIIWCSELDFSLHAFRLRVDYFLLEPMVHWPEVMTAYEETEKILFSADAFGRFGSLERTARAPWVPQARRYYYNIIGKYGAQVQALLKKISALEIKTICPLHGPMLTEDLGEYLRLYDLWSQWKPEEPEGILIAHASIHGNTAHAAKTLKGKLEKKGVQVNICDLTVTDLSYAVASAFYCGKLVLASSTYDGGLFPPMREFLEHLRTKGFRNRWVGLIEDGSWAPAAARLMRTKLEEMKDIHLYETVVSLRGALNQTSEAQMDALVAELCAE